MSAWLPRDLASPSLFPSFREICSCSLRRSRAWSSSFGRAARGSSRLPPGGIARARLSGSSRPGTAAASSSSRSFLGRCAASRSRTTWASSVFCASSSSRSLACSERSACSSLSLAHTVSPGSFSAQGRWRFSSPAGAVASSMITALFFRRASRCPVTPSFSAAGAVSFFSLSGGAPRSVYRSGLSRRGIFLLLLRSP